MDSNAILTGRVQTRAAAPRRSVAPREWLAAAAAVNVLIAIAMTVLPAAAEAATETVAAATGVQDKNVGVTTAGALDSSVHANWYARCDSRYDTCTESVRCYDRSTLGCHVSKDFMVNKCCSCYSACKKSGRRKYREQCRTRSCRFGRTR